MAWVRESLHEALLAQSRVIWADWEDQPPSAEWTEFVHDGIEQHVRSCFDQFCASCLKFVFDLCAHYLKIWFQVPFLGIYLAYFIIECEVSRIWA